MIYKIDVAISANTAIKDAVDTTMLLTKGRIKKVEIYFPWGCAGLVGLQIIRNTWQLAPLTRGQWLKGNDILLSHTYDYDLDVEPYELIVKSYNLDDTYEHTPFVIIEIIRDRRSISLDKLLAEL
jgi:hypothetical protein